MLLWRRLRQCATAAAALAEAVPPEGEWEAGERRVFGTCAPAVSEGRKLCCGSIVCGLLNSGSDGGRH